MKELPKEFVDRMKLILGNDFSKYEQAVNSQPVRAYRVNTNKISVFDFLALGQLKGEKIPYCETGFFLNEDKIGFHPFFHSGMIYVQEPAAMMPVECVDIDPDWCVLDMCASPGGKSSQIRNKLNESSVLVSNEIVPSRCKVLVGNIERMGFKNTVTTCLDTEKLAHIFPKRFDFVSVDAPCSGEGMFRKDDTAIAEWSVENVKKCSERQKMILENAARCVKDGGVILYATCTFSIEENEKIIDDFLCRHPEFELIEAKTSVQKYTCDGIKFDGCKTENISFCRRFYPHTGQGEGQFAAVLRSTLKKPTEYKAENKSKTKTDPLVQKFLSEVLSDFDPTHILMNKNVPVYFTPDFSVAEKTAFTLGVTIGEIRKGYIQPHHQFFTSMGHKFKRKVELSPESEKLKKYLRGESFDCECENGWAVVTVCGCPLGGIKVVDNVAKNHYPKGLRT